MRSINSFYTLVFSATMLACASEGSNKKTDADNLTKVTVTVPDTSAEIDPMIYGQMFENVNDRVIYDGIVNKDGSARPHVDEMLKPLNIPVMRWPGGTVVHEYQWEKGIGPRDERPTVDNIHWGGIENYRFGTDEFLMWCEKMDIPAYINFNMSNHPELGGSLQDALNWIEYVNGAPETPYGKKRVNNGRKEPYNVPFWCIGNENWGGWGVHTEETAAVYGDRLFEWAGTIRKSYPDLKLLGVGHTYAWDSTVLLKNSELIDYLTQHYYINAKVKDDQYQNPESPLFAPAWVEAHLERLSRLVQAANKKAGREDNPIRLSVDEWNNRHQVFNGEKYQFTRQDLRRQLDVAVVAGMLNVFIRQSPTVGMANYIFPVNGHGLIRTIGDDDAFITPIYYVFKQYRKMMVGKKLSVEVTGPGIIASEAAIEMAGDATVDKVDLKGSHLNYIDVAAVINENGNINVALVNRSPDQEMEVKLTLPEAYQPQQQWHLFSAKINDTNTANDRDNVKPVTEKFDKIQKDAISISPCGLTIIQYARTN